MKSILTLLVTLLIGAGIAGSERALSAPEAQKAVITVRTENYPRPPYSGATYYIYEGDGQVICTKLRVCNKYDDCETEYRKGVFKEEEDIETGEPYGKSKAVVIPSAKLRKHVCLTRFKLVK